MSHSRGLQCILIVFLFSIPGALAQERSSVHSSTGSEAETLFHEASRCLQVGGQQEKGLAPINEAIKLEPGNADFHATKAAILFSMEEDEEALKEADTALKIAPENLDALCVKGRILARLGHPEEGVRLLGQVIERRPLPDYYSMRARLYFNMKKYKDSATDLRTAIKLNKNLDSLHLDLTFTLEAMEDWPGVIEEATTAMRVGNDPRQKALKSRARAYTHLKQYDRAIADLKTALRVWPDEMKTHRQLQQVYLLKGDKVNAAAEQRFIDKMNLDLTGHN